MPGTSVLGLGTFEVRVGDQPLDRWGGGKARELLQYLLLHRGQVVLRPALEASLWPHRTVGSSSSIKVAAHALRRVLREAEERAGIPAADGTLELVTQGSGYMLRTRRVNMDFETFQDCVTRAQEADAARRPDAAHVRYRAAVGRYAGDLLPGVDSNWVELPREFHRRQMLSALDRLAEIDLARGSSSEVLRWCRRSIEVDPLHEAAYCRLMTLHGRLGQSRMVRHWFRRCVAALRENIDVAPEPATVAAYQAALAADPADHLGDGRSGTGPEMWRVLVTDRREFALVPPDSPVPEGWLEAGVSGSAQHCARWVEEA